MVVVEDFLQTSRPRFPLASFLASPFASTMDPQAHPTRLLHQNPNHRIERPLNLAPSSALNRHGAERQLDEHHCLGNQLPQSRPPERRRNLLILLDDPHHVKPQQLSRILFSICYASEQLRAYRPVDDWEFRELFADYRSSLHGKPWIVIPCDRCPARLAKHPGDDVVIPLINYSNLWSHGCRRERDFDQHYETLRASISLPPEPGRGPPIDTATPVFIAPGTSVK